MKALSSLSDAELDAAHMAVQAERAAAEAGYKADAAAIQSEQDKRALAAAVANVPSEMVAAILAAHAAEQEG